MKTSTEPLVRIALNGPTMGTRYAAVFYADGHSDRAAIAAELQAAVDRVDAEMSTWKPQSDLCRISAAPPGQWIAAPARLLLVVDAALAVGRASGGAFDIGVGAAVDAFGFGPSGPGPNPLRIAGLGRSRPPAHEAIVIDHAGQRLRKGAPLSLDLSGIAKGFGVDELAGVLDRRNVANYLVAIDGELRAAGRKPDGTAWSVGVERPDAGARAALGVVELDSAAVATSGSYRHRARWEATEISHTIDPRTGRPVRNAVASVTVLHRECMLADAWATALLVLGETDGLAFAAEHGIEALFLVAADDGPRQVGTGAFAAG